MVQWLRFSHYFGWLVKWFVSLPRCRHAWIRFPQETQKIDSRSRPSRTVWERRVTLSHGERRNKSTGVIRFSDAAVQKWFNFSVLFKECRFYFRQAKKVFCLLNQDTDYRIAIVDYFSLAAAIIRDGHMPDMNFSTWNHACSKVHEILELQEQNSSNFI